MAAKLYIASYDVNLFGNPYLNTDRDHSYIYYDPDGVIGNGDEKIIRGGPKENYRGSSKVTAYSSDPDVTSPSIIVELRDDARNSYDYRLNVQTPADQDFRLILSGAAATNAFNDMWNFAITLGNSISGQHGLYDAGIDYSLLGPNSNSVVNSILNANGLNFRDITPYADGSTSVIQDPSEFPGHMGLLDGSGDNAFTAYVNTGGFTETTVFYKRGGNDNRVETERMAA